MSDIYELITYFTITFFTDTMLKLLLLLMKSCACVVHDHHFIVSSKYVSKKALIVFVQGEERPVTSVNQ